MTKQPNSRRNLDMAIHRMAASDKDFVKLRALLANAIVGQMLPNGAVKGGTALKFRFGDAATRFTTDLALPGKAISTPLWRSSRPRFPPDGTASQADSCRAAKLARRMCRPSTSCAHSTSRSITVGNHGAPSRWKSDTMSWAMPTSPNACFHQISHACFESLGFPIPTPCPSCRSTIKSLRNCTGQANREANGPTTSSISKSLCEERRLTRP